MSLTLEEARAKAEAYGTGQVPIRHLPPTPPREKTSGLCDYCNKVRPVVHQTSNKLFLVCWTCQMHLKTTVGEDWQVKANTTLERNKQARSQEEAIKANKKKGVPSV